MERRSKLSDGLQNTQKEKISRQEIDSALTNPHDAEKLFKSIRDQTRLHEVARHGDRAGRKSEIMGRIMKHLDPSFSGSKLIESAEKTFALTDKAIKEIRNSQFSGKEEVLETLKSQKRVLNDLREATNAITGNFKNFQGIARTNFDVLDTWTGNKYRDEAQAHTYYKEVRKGGNIFQNAPGDTGDLMRGIDLGNMTSPVLNEYIFSTDSKTLRPAAPFGRDRPEKIIDDGRIASDSSGDHAFQSATDIARISDNHTTSQPLRHVDSLESFISVDSLQERPSFFLEKDLREHFQEELDKSEKKIIDSRDKGKGSLALLHRAKQSMKIMHLAHEVNVLSVMLDDPQRRIQRIKDLPEIKISPAMAQEAVDDAKAIALQKVLQGFGKHFVSSVYKDTWQHPDSAAFVNEIKYTHDDLMDSIEQMQTYAERITKNVQLKEKAPNTAEVESAINDYKKACQDFSFYVVENLNALQNQAIVSVGGNERLKTFGLVQNSYEATGSIGNLLQAELKAVVNNMVSTAIGKII